MIYYPDVNPLQYVVPCDLNRVGIPVATFPTIADYKTVFVVDCTPLFSALLDLVLPTVVCICCCDVFADYLFHDPCG